MKSSYRLLSLKEILEIKEHGCLDPFIFLWEEKHNYIPSMDLYWILNFRGPYLLHWTGESSIVFPDSWVKKLPNSSVIRELCNRFQLTREILQRKGLKALVEQLNKVGWIKER